MKESLSSPEPLQGDPARKAPDLHRGIIFQIWLSVEAWVCLKEDEYLFLEEAEDFDVVSTSDGIASQAKATSNNITLRSKDVVEALVNFWLIREKNHKKNISFRFITTSAIGVEKSTPFGKGVAGLNVWKECSDNKDVKLAKKIQTFLATDSSVAPYLDIKDSENEALPKLTLLKFLEQSTPENVINQLIIPMSWEADSADEDTIKETISIRLRAHGAKHGILPSACNRVLDRLYVVAAETAKKKSNRILSRDDFIQEFGKATSQTVSNEELATLRANTGMMNLFGTAASGAAEMLITRITPIQQGIPTLPDSTIGRHELVETGSKKLADQEVIVMNGSSGMGKSTTANLIAPNISGQWIWVDLQNVAFQNLPLLIQELSRLLASSSESCNVCLDNLNYSASELLGVELGLSAFLRIILGGNGKVIITTQRKLPIIVVSKMGLSVANMWSVPRFDQEEIKNFAELLGCPNNISSLFGEVVFMQTSGHPRLVHARLAGLRSYDWPLPSSKALVEPPDEVLQEQEISRQLLEGIQDSDKELLYRLSISSGPFRKDHAIAVGQAAPSLGYPADSFARLVGPWIDTVGDEYYRISPLLTNAASNNWSKDKVNKARRSLAQAMLAQDDRTLIEASEIMKQGIICGDEESLTGVALALLSPPQSAKRSIAENLGWLIAVGREEGEKIFKGNEYLNVILRIIQFGIAVEITPDYLDDLCKNIDDDFSVVDLEGEQGEGLRIMWLSIAIISVEANITPELMVGYWAELVDLLSKNPDYLEQFSMMDKAFESIAEWGDGNYHSQFLLMVIMRNMDTRVLRRVASAINNLPLDIKEIAIDDLKELLFPLRLLVDRSWIIELDKGNTDWEEVLDNFEALKVDVKDWGIQDLNIYIARAMAAICDEYLEQAPRALGLLQEAKNENEGLTHLLEDQEAMVLYRSNHYKEAVVIWEKILPSWPIIASLPDRLPIYACERAGHASAQIPDWDQAIKFIKLGQTIAEKMGEPLYELSYLADEAFVLWKNGSKIESVDLMSKVLSALEIFDVTKADSLQLHRFRKMFEQVMKWCQFDAGCSREEDVWEPPVGACSRLNDDEKIFEYDAAPTDLQWFFLASIEVHLCETRTVFRIALERTMSSSYAAFRYLMNYLALKVAFLDFDFSDLMGLTCRLNQAMADSVSQTEMGKTTLEPDSFEAQPAKYSPEVFEGVIIAALVVLASKGKSLNSSLADWKDSLTAFPIAEDVISVISQVERISKTSVLDVIKIHQSDQESLVTRRIASVRMSQDLQFSLKVMLIGQASLMDYCSQFLLTQEIEDDLAELFKKLWLFRIKLPAAFISPRVTIPPLQEVLASDAKGLKMAASILLKARHAVILALPDETVASWKSIAEA